MNRYRTLITPYVKTKMSPHSLSSRQSRIWRGDGRQAFNIANGGKAIKLLGGNNYETKV